eukprot:TRINITY_DN3172_c0_g1_i5.p1 TRINITY_DN3172_c0_g1~~TRINITY_DN3172_c0_g1_i5.p1  ORF type:complete len:212 (-),score=61.46 TRINITY_DN3172_c0_g1_i5:141-776(-)
MNSLLQALFMTPEFRRGLYDWPCEEDETEDEDEVGDIPQELQRLFGLMQLSEQQYYAVETTALTKSFGWEDSDAFVQNDVSELTRILFAALEELQEEHSSSDPTLVSRLYQGVMKDYVKCLECQNENTKAATFLDLSLDIHNVQTLEQALDKFVTPETLDGNNQYSCDTCEHHVDALKGLLFEKLPVWCGEREGEREGGRERKGEEDISHN